MVVTAGRHASFTHHEQKDLLLNVFKERVDVYAKSVANDYLAHSKLYAAGCVAMSKARPGMLVCPWLPC